MTSGHPEKILRRKASQSVCTQFKWFFPLTQGGHFPNFLLSKNTASLPGSRWQKHLIRRDALSHFNCRQKASLKILRHHEDNREENSSKSAVQLIHSDLHTIHIPLKCKSDVKYSVPLVIHANQHDALFFPLRHRSDRDLFVLSLMQSRQ